MQPNNYKYFFEQAVSTIMQDLLDCLLVEDFFSSVESNIYTPLDWDREVNNDLLLKVDTLFSNLPIEACLWRVPIDVAKVDLVFAVQPAITQTWGKVPLSPVYAISTQDQLETMSLVESLSPESLMLYVFQLQKAEFQGKEEGIQRVMQALKESIVQLSWSQQHNIDYTDLLDKSPANLFQTLEQWASIRDRPYHPLAKAKLGLSKEEYHDYMAEFCNKISLNWVAIPKQKIMVGSGVKQFESQKPADYFLSAVEQASLIKELEDLNIANSHIAIPVHPWQLTFITRNILKEALEKGDYQVLSFQSSPYFATSSLRSMSPSTGSPYYLKLPMSIYSLASSRFLPALKMINGQKSEALMREGIKHDAILKEKLYLCDERVWWAYLPENTKNYEPDNETLFTQPPRHLSAMLRCYPEELIQDQQYRLLPMAALGTRLPDSPHHFFDDWIQYRQLPESPKSVVQLFRELCRTFFEVNFRMFKLGMLGEVHGQNTVLVWKNGFIEGLLLRDHDSLRIYVPWLQKYGMDDPNYTIKKDYPNTLYHDTPESLFFYFQTLALQVNLRSIIDVLSEIYTINNAVLWQEMGKVLKDTIKSVHFESSIESMLNKILFEDEVWPFKMLIKPIIDRGSDPGSMPFGVGTIPNPFLQLDKFL